MGTVTHVGMGWLCGEINWSKKMEKNKEGLNFVPGRIDKNKGLDICHE